MEARYYSFWILCIILLHATLLKALHKNSIKWWGIYSVVTVISLYTSAFSALVLLGHGIFIVVYKREKLKAFLLSGIVILISYLPWMLKMIHASSEILTSTAWQETKPKFWEILLGYWFGLANTFAPLARTGKGGAAFLYWNEANGPLNTVIQGILVIGIVIALIFFLRKSSRRILLFSIPSLIIMLLFLNGFDFFSGRNISLVYRYHMPNMVLVFIILTFGLYHMAVRYKWGILLFALVGGICIFQSFRITTDSCFGNPINCDEQQIIIAELEKSENPLIVTEARSVLIFLWWESLISLKNDKISVLLNPSHEDLTRYMKSDRSCF